ncbi:hypothetical protein GCM10009412_30020 [Aeromonas salmonicida subsp. achromogenes]
MAATIQRDQASAAGESNPTASLLTMALPDQMAMQEKGNKKARGVTLCTETIRYFRREYKGANKIRKHSPALRMRVTLNRDRTEPIRPYQG